MRFLPSQILLIAGLVAFAWYVFRVRSVLFDRIIYLILAGGGLVFVLHPSLSTWIANRVGIGRGTDLVFYTFIIFSLFYFVNITSELKRLEQKMTELVRTLALATPVAGQGPSPVKRDDHPIAPSRPER